MDNNVENGVNYCYRIESNGTYAIGRIEEPILNFSQRACSIPIDQEAPCKPLLNVKTICDAHSFDPDELINRLNWNEPISCNDQELPDKYQVYFKQNQNEEPQLIASLPGTVNTFEHLPDSNDISGCYIVTAVDKAGNESAKTGEVCVSNCPVYELPNTFTPNGDGDNEVFKPMKNYFIHSIDMKIFNEWGVRVFTTTLPQILWNGKDEQGKNLADGSYYYHCTVYVKSSEGLGRYKELKGYINILR